MATFYIAGFPNSSIDGLVYMEAGVFLHVEDDNGPARFCCWIVVNDDAALIGGRELQGFPKKLAEISPREDVDKAIGSVVRKGVEVF